MGEPQVVAMCAKCRRAPVDIEVDTLGWQKAFNRQLIRMGQKPIGIHELALCESCYDGWLADRASFAAQRRSREYRARRDFKTTAEQQGVEAATLQIPAEFRRDFEFMQKANNWERWSRTKGKRGKDPL